MTITNKSTMRTEAIFSEDMSHRYLLRKDWSDSRAKGKDIRRATIIMIHPSSANEVELDRTTVTIINNLNRLGYHMVDICNLFSTITTKIKMNQTLEELVHQDNDILIEKSCLKSEICILAWGSFADNMNRKVMNRIAELMVRLEPFHDRLHYISDEKGIKSYHPLAPQAHTWYLKNWGSKKEVKETTNKKPANNLYMQSK